MTKDSKPQPSTATKLPKDFVKDVCTNVTKSRDQVVVKKWIESLPKK